MLAQSQMTDVLLSRGEFHLQITHIPLKALLLQLRPPKGLSRGGSSQRPGLQEATPAKESRLLHGEGSGRRGMGGGCEGRGPSLLCKAPFAIPADIRILCCCWLAEGLSGVLCVTRRKIQNLALLCCSIVQLSRNSVSFQVLFLLQQ